MTYTYPEAVLPQEASQNFSLFQVNSLTHSRKPQIEGVGGVGEGGNKVLTAEHN